MKTLALLFCAAVIMQVSQARTPSALQDQPEVKILKSSWRKIPGAIPSKDTRDADIDARINEEYRDKQPNWKELDKLEIDKPHQELTRSAPREAREKAYEYKIEIKNGSSKEVVGLKWTYVFTDPISRRELVRHSFESKMRIGPGKEKTLSAYTDASPPIVVNAQAQTDKGSAWDEAIIVESVQYSDGAIWKRN
jgi:hypothetical protein